MKTGTLLLLGGLAVLAVKTGVLGRLGSAVPNPTAPGGGGGDPVSTPIDVVVTENPTPASLPVKTIFANPWTERNNI